MFSQTVQTPQFDFSYNLDVYNQSYGYYQEKKQINLQYNSLATEKELLEAIKISLNARNGLIISYLNLITSGLEIYKQADYQESTQNTINLLSQDSIWLMSQTTLVDKIANQDQLKDYNNQFKENYQSIKQHISLARSQYHLNHQYQITKDLQSFLSNTDKPITNQDWLNDINSQLNTCLDIFTQAYSTAQKTSTSQYRNFTDFYPDVKQELDVSYQNLSKIVDNIESYYKKFY